MSEPATPTSPVAAPTERPQSAQLRGEGVLASVEAPGTWWPSVLTLPEAAAFLRISAGRLRSLALGGDVPGYRIGQQWRFSTEALRLLLDDTTPKTALASKQRPPPAAVTSAAGMDAAATGTLSAGTPASTTAAAPGAPVVPVVGSDAARSAAVPVRDGP